MKKSIFFLAAFICFAGSASATAIKTYQVTGPVLAMTADSITVQKGNEKWEIARGTATVPPNVKIGSKVTIQYAMKAISVGDKGSSQ